MHELAIAQNIISAVRTALERHGGGRVLRLRLRIGELSGVEVESLRFCYEASVRDTPLAGSLMEVERVRSRCRCPACGALFRHAKYSRTCPECGDEGGELVEGTELELVDFEVE